MNPRTFKEINKCETPCGAFGRMSTTLFRKFWPSLGKTFPKQSSSWLKSENFIETAKDRMGKRSRAHEPKAPDFLWLPRRLTASQNGV